MNFFKYLFYKLSEIFANCSKVNSSGLTFSFNPSFCKTAIPFDLFSIIFVLTNEFNNVFLL